jgi:hypothetical protein
MEFTDFLAPLDVGAFRSQYYGNRPVHLRRDGAPSVKSASILNWQRFNEVLSLTPYWNEDTLKLAFNSHPAPRENYCDVTDLARGASAPMNPAKVKALMGLGASLVANHIHRVCPEVGAVARMLERELAARVVANVYCSFKGVQSYLPDARTEAALRERLARLAERIKTVVTSPAFAVDVLNHQRGLAATAAEFELPARQPPSWYSLARKAQVARRDHGFAAVFEGGEIALGATYPTVEWILKQRLFSLDDAAARQSGVDKRELRSVLEQLAGAGIIVATEMR